jgi:hypothetical protein
MCMWVVNQRIASADQRVRSTSYKEEKLNGHVYHEVDDFYRHPVLIAISRSTMLLIFNKQSSC